jgi:hypothetical protein
MGGVVELGSAPSCKDGRGKAIGGGVLGPLPYGQSVCPLILSLVAPPPPSVMPFSCPSRPSSPSVNFWKFLCLWPRKDGDDPWSGL